MVKERSRDSVLGTMAKVVYKESKKGLSRSRNLRGKRVFDIMKVFTLLLAQPKMASYPLLTMFGGRQCMQIGLSLAGGCSTKHRKARIKTRRFV
jgi:hypothetical protein